MVATMVVTACLLLTSTQSLFSRSHSQPDVDLARPPDMVSPQLTNITVPIGSTARLHCTVNNVENQAVSWIRLSDYQILTNGLVTITSDKRMSLLRSPGGAGWTLQIKSVKTKDQGGYQCQAATATGARTLTSWLWVFRPQAVILGSREKHVNLGDSVTITCELRDNKGGLQPDFVFWYHNSTMINFAPGVLVTTAMLDPEPDSLWVPQPNTTVSRLHIAETREDQAGDYTCAPSNTISDTVRLSLSSDTSLVMQRRRPSQSSGGRRSVLGVLVTSQTLMSGLGVLVISLTLLRQLVAS